MRFRWLAIVVLLGAVAMSASIEAQNKRTASLSVRVLVVRPCLVNTAATSGGGELNCDVPGAPAPRMNTTPFQGAQPGSTTGQPQTPAFGATAPATSSTLAPPPAAMTTLSGSNGTSGPADADASSSPASPDASPVVTANGDGTFTASPATSDPTAPVQKMEGLQVLTVNF